MIYLTSQFDITSCIPDHLLPYATMYSIDQLKLPDHVNKLISNGQSFIGLEYTATYHGKEVPQLLNFTLDHGDIAVLITYRNHKYQYVAIEICDDQFNTQFDNFVTHITDDNLIEYRKDNVEHISNLCVFSDIFDAVNSLGLNVVKEFIPELLTFEYK